MVGGWTETILMLFSTQVEVEVGVELGKINLDSTKMNLDVKCNLDLTLGVVSTFTGGRVVGWMLGKLESNAKLNSRSD